jgi:hypothetical protein
MHAFARERVQVCRQGGNERFTFTRTHFGNTALMQTDTADNLHAEMAHIEYARRRLSQRRKRVV